MNLTAYLKRIRGRLRIPENDAMFPGDVLTGFLNDALQEIATTRSWTWLEATDATNTATIAGTASYTLPTNFVKSITLTVSGVLYDEISDDDAAVYLTHAIWPARGFTVDGATGTFTLYPTPGSVETIFHRYTRTESTLIDNNDEPLLPDRFAGVAVDKACELATIGSSDNRSGLFATRYTTGLARMYDDLRQSSGPKRIKSRLW